MLNLPLHDEIDKDCEGVISMIVQISDKKSPRRNTLLPVCVFYSTVVTSKPLFQDMARHEEGSKYIIIIIIIIIIIVVPVSGGGGHDPSSHNHGSEKWVPATVVSFHLG